MIKGYTDIKQSEKLAEILPLESADMWYDNNGESIAGRPEIRCCSFVGLASINIPCWSLAALIELLPPIDNLKPMIDLEGNSIYYSGHNTLCTNGDTLIDACVNMIFKLNEQNLI